MKLKTIFLCLAMGSGYVNCQTLKTYSGKYEYGTATYSYYENSSFERIYEGIFSYRSGFDDAYNEKSVITGKYSNNFKNGLWQYKNYRPEYWSIIIEGNYNNGRKNGKWHLKSKYYSSNIMTLQFRNDTMVGNFSYADSEKNSVTGQFDQEGNFDGIWKIVYNEKIGVIEDIKKFKKGFLFFRLLKNTSTGEIFIKNDFTKILPYLIQGDSFTQSVLMRPYSLKKVPIEDEFYSVPYYLHNLDFAAINYWFGQKHLGIDYIIYNFAPSHEDNPPIGGTYYICYMDGQKIISDEDFVALLDDIQKKEIVNEEKYKEILFVAESNFSERQYEDAISQYREALEFHDNSEIRNKISEAELMLEKERKFILKGEENLKNKKFEEALKEYNQALLIRDSHHVKEKISIATTLFEEHKASLAFLKERNSTIYDFSKFDQIYLDEIKAKIEDKIKTCLLSNPLTFTSSITFNYNIDTIGNTSSSYKINNTTDEALSNEIGKIGKEYKLHPIYKNGFTLNSKAEILINSSSSSEIFNAKKERDGTVAITPFPSSQKRIYIENLTGYPGKYKIQINCAKNKEEVCNSKVLSYDNNNGPANAFLSLLVPGLGDKRVSSEAKSGWGVTLVTYGLLGTGVTCMFYSTSEYDKYHSATLQKDMDTHYSNANWSNKASYSLISLGILCWTYDVIWVTYKGSKNKQEIKRYKNQFGISYIPCDKSAVLTYLFNIPHGK